MYKIVGTRVVSYEKRNVQLVLELLLRRLAKGGHRNTGNRLTTRQHIIHMIDQLLHTLSQNQIQYKQGFLLELMLTSR
jgi:hypothetical protein